jgi:hypothetical protein
MMKHRLIPALTALMLAGATAARAQSTIAYWTFEDTVAINNNPIANTNNSSGVVSMGSLNMTTYPSPGLGATNGCDIAKGKAGDTGLNLIADTTDYWRVRGQGSGDNGWSSNAPVCTQGMQINVDTSGYQNLTVGFDWYLTTQAEANMCAQYTTDGTHWSNVVLSVPAADISAGLTVVDNTTGSDTDSVTNMYVSDNVLLNPNGGQDWFTNLSVAITDPLAANNPNFAFRIVNASTSNSCIGATGTPYNNNSGNWRFDNVYVTGTASSAFSPPTLTNSTNATVDGPFTNTFADSAAWRAKIGSIKVNGTVLPTAAYVISAGQIVYTPSASALLQTAGAANISVFATNYSVAQLSQYIGPGAPKSLSISGEPVGPSGSGGTLETQPALTVDDQYGNVATNCSGIYTATASAGWSFGTASGTMQPLTNGTAAFTNLSAVNNGSVAIANATITLTASGGVNLGGLPFTTTNSASFVIPAPRTAGFTAGNLAILALDSNPSPGDNTTFSIYEVNPNVSNSVPVNIYPIDATTTNGMRESTSSSTGLLSTSQDGTLLCFDAFQSQDSTVQAETDVLNRGCGTLDANGNYVQQASYISSDTVPLFGATQPRSATTIDDQTFYMGDKLGVFTNDDNVIVTGTGGNVRPLKPFAGKIYTMTQSGSSQPTAILMQYVNGDSLYPMNGFPVEPLAGDFYMISSGSNGATNDILYYIDPTNKTSGAIFKFCLSYDPNNNDNNGQQGWVPAGSTQLLINGGVLNSAPTPDGGVGLYAQNSPGGGVDIFYTTGTGGTASNSLVKVHDSSGYNQGISLGTFQTLYTAPAAVTLKGLALAPQPLVLKISSVTKTGSGPGSAASVGFNYETGMSISVHASSNINTPAASWPVIGTAVEGPYGHYSFTDPSPATNSAQFYRLSIP